MDITTGSLLNESIQWFFFRGSRVFHGDRPSATCPPWWNVWRRLRIKLAWLRTTGRNGGKKGKMIGKMMEGFSFFVAGGDFIRIIGYNVVYFFHDYYICVKPYTYYSFIHVISLLMSVVIKHLSLTLLNSVKGVTIQGWHDWHPLAEGRHCDSHDWMPQFLWKAGLVDELLPANWWKSLVDFTLTAGNWFLLNPDDFFREKCCCASCWWDLGLGFNVGVGHLWLRSDSLARCKPWSWDFCRFKSTTSPNFWRMEWRKGRNEIGKKKKHAIGTGFLSLFFSGGSECIPGWF